MSAAYLHVRSGQDPFTEVPKDTCVNGSKTCNKQIDIGHMNFEGLASKLCEPDFVKYVKSFDIFCAVETFTHFQFDFSIHFSDYVVFHSPAKKKKKFLNMEDDQEE